MDGADCGAEKGNCGEGAQGVNGAFDSDWSRFFYL